MEQIEHQGGIHDQCDDTDYRMGRHGGLLLLSSVIGIPDIQAQPLQKDAAQQHPKLDRPDGKRNTKQPRFKLIQCGYKIGQQTADGKHQEQPLCIFLHK